MKKAYLILLPLLLCILLLALPAFPASLAVRLTQATPSTLHIPLILTGAGNILWTPTATATAAPTETPTPTATDTETPTKAPTATASPTPTDTATPTDSPTPTVTGTSTATPTTTSTATATPTATLEPLHEIVFRQGDSPSVLYRGVSDSWIDRRYPTENHSGDASLQVGKWGAAGTRRILIQFQGLGDSIPPTAQVVSATLYLKNAGYGAQNARIDAMRVLRAWTAAEANWAQADAAAAWALPGCSSPTEREVDAESQNANAGDSFLSWDLTKLVQSWIVQPESNHGVMLMNNLLSDVSYPFFSSEAALAANRPYLQVRYREHGGAAPVKPTPLVSFAVYGDSRISAQIYPPQQMAMTNEIVRRQPDFVFHLGDMVHYGLDLAGWEMLRRDVFAPYLQMPPPQGLSDCIPLAAYENPAAQPGLCDRGLFALPGNHEYMEISGGVLKAENIEPYLEFFSYLPNGGRNYSFNIVNERFAGLPFSGVHVVAMDSLPYEMSFDRQVRLLERDLAANEGKLVITFLHQTMYSLGKAFGNTGLRQRYGPLLHQYPRALLTFSGDDHSYQRLQPPGDYITYIIAAGGGAKLYDQAIFPNNWSKAVFIKAFSYARAAVYADHIELRAYMIEDSGEAWCMDVDFIPIPS
jgi:hypothetical protein